MKRLSEKLLARYHDGEIGEKGIKRVEAIITDSARDRELLDGMSRIGDLLRLMNEENLDSVSFEGFEQRVRNSLDRAGRPGFFESVKVWMSEFFEHRKTVWIPTASLVGAAAAVLLALPLVTGTVPPATDLGDDVSSGIWAAAADRSPGGSEVSLMNREPAVGTEYSVLNERGETIGIVWIDE